MHVYGSGDTYVVLSIDVDDVLLLGVTPSVVTKVRRQLMSKFSMTNLGSASLVLGMEIAQGPGYITVTQRHYVQSVLDCFGFLDATPAPTPVVPLPLAPDGGTLLDAAGVKRYRDTKRSLDLSCICLILLAGTSASRS